MNNRKYMFEAFANDKKLKALVFLVLILTSLALFAYAHLAYTEAKFVGGEMSTISVSGTSERFVRPDVATFTFSVRAEDKESTSAQEKSAEATNAAIAYIKEQGVLEGDIKTIGYSVSQKFERDDTQPQICTGFYCPPGKEVLAGFVVEQTISVKVRAIDTAGALLSGVTEKGATNVSSLSFEIDDPEAVEGEVRDEAIKEAQEKAKALAKSLDVRLGRLVSYSDGGYSTPYAYGGMEARAMDAASVKVEPGENQISSQVTLIYEVR